VSVLRRSAGVAVLDRALRRGMSRTPRRAAAAGAVATIYEQLTAAAVNVYLQGLAGTADDLTPIAGWNFDASGAAIFGGPEYDLAAQSGAVLVASAHGQAAQQTTNGACWALADAATMNFGTDAFFILGLLTIPAAPGAARPWFAKGTSASNHYALMVDTSRQPVLEMKKPGGGPTTVTATYAIATNTPTWFAGWRSSTAAKIGVGIPAGTLEADYAGSNDVGNASQVAGLWGGSSGGVTSACDHLLAWRGTQAEKMRTHVAATMAALGAIG
jgi:hypothetical protein